MDREIVMEAKNLEHMYDNGVKALKGVNFKIYEGEFVGLIGQNGSGKSTLAKHLNGLLRPTAGSYYINGKDVSKSSIISIAKTVGFVFQNPDHQIFCPTVREELAFGPKNMDLTENEVIHAVDDALERFGLTEFADYPPAILGFGIRRKVSLAAIYSMKPKVMIMDEPTTGLDFKSATELMKIVSELNCLGHTIILITHDMRMVAEYTKRSLVLRGGEVIMDGETKEVLKNFEMLEKTQITPPQVVELTNYLKAYGLKNIAMSNDEFMNEYENLKKNAV